MGQFKPDIPRLARHITQRRVVKCKRVWRVLARCCGQVERADRLEVIPVKTNGSRQASCSEKLFVLHPRKELQRLRRFRNVEPVMGDLRIRSAIQFRNIIPWPIFMNGERRQDSFI